MVYFDINIKVKAMKRRVSSGSVDREPRQAEKGKWMRIRFVLWNRLEEAAEDGLGAAHRGKIFLRLRR
jgi:hypothetical protein